MQKERLLCRACLVAGVAVGMVAQGHAQSTPLEAAKMFLVAFNAGDNAKAAALISSGGVTIVDEFAPHLWSGKSGFSAWMADFDKDAKTKVLSEPMVTMEAPLVNTVTAMWLTWFAR